jgi:ATP-dependent Clp protease ATP-binding subunit ClpC
MYERFTDRARKVMQLANQEAQRFNHEYIGTEHLLLGLVKEGTGVAANVLNDLGFDLRIIRLEVEKIVQASPDMVRMGKLPLTPRVKMVIEYAIEEARNLNHNYIGTEHLLLGLVREEGGVAAQVLMNLGLKLNDVRSEVLNLLGHDLRPELSGLQFQSPATPKKTPALDSFGLDLTNEAKHGRLAAIQGRKEELDGIISVLSCLSHNNPILVGEPGVGKGAIVRGLAHFSASDNWPATLNRRRLIALDFSYLVATAENDEQFQKGIRALMKDLRVSNDILLYLNDLQRFFQPPGTVVAEYLWSAFRSGLARGQIQCVGQATPQQYQSWIGSDAFLSRHFQPIFVAPLSKVQTLEALHFNRGVYENHYRVEITVAALEAAVELCEHHVKDRCLPGKAIQLLEMACALVRLQQTATPLDLKELDAEIDQINKEKEGAVAEQDFARAAHLRDQADQLKKRRSEIEAEWNKEAFTRIGTVDKEAVEKALARMSGSQLP